MNESNQGRYAVILILISFLFVAGSLIAAFAESNTSSGDRADTSDTQLITDIVFFTPTTGSTTQSPFPTGTNPPTSTSTVQMDSTETEPPPILSQCDPPENWGVLFIQYGQTLEEIAQEFQTTVSDLIAGNCLSSTDLPPGYIIFVPPLNPTITASSSSSCSPPAGWITYTVRSGDTLFKISQAYQTTVAALQEANCMGTSTKIITGRTLWVPNVPTITPTPTSKSAKSTNTPVPNKAPVAKNDGPFLVAPGGTLNIPAPGVLDNDSDQDHDALNATLVDGLGPVCATYFLLNPDGSFIYKAETTPCSDTFSYTANDGKADSNIATVTIKIQ